MNRFIKETLLLARLKLNKFKKPKQIYAGRLIDAMMQINGTITAESIEHNMKEANIDHMCLFSRQQEPYDSTQHVIDVAKQLGNKITRGSHKRFDQQDDLTPQFVKDTIQSVKQGARFIGELQCAHADKYDNGDNPTNEVTLRKERYLNVMSPNFLKLMDALDGKGIPVFVHWEIYHWERDWPQFTQLFARYPNINFVWPHGGYGKAVYVNEVLNKHKNVYVTISKRDLFFFKKTWLTYQGEYVGAWSVSNTEWQDKLGSSILNPDGSIQREWQHLFKRYSDKFMFATDCHKWQRWVNYVKIVNIWRGILGQIPIEYAEKIAFKNAKKLFKVK
jgi:predicted TIM-barrel fold metal-dependent hydrolase